MAELSNLKKRRSATKGSITRLLNRVKTLESKRTEASTLDLANQLMPTLRTLDEQFKTQHFSIVDTIDESDADSLAREQDALDKHDDEVAELSLRITQLLRDCNTASDSGARKTLSRRLTDLKARLEMVDSAASSLTSSTEHALLLQQYHEKLGDFKTELGSIRQAVLTAGVDSSDDLFETVSYLDKGMFDTMLKIKKLLNPSKDSIGMSSDSSPGVKLPKLDVPTFNGDILKWVTFWEQFTVSVHDRPHLSKAEKLAYLRHSLKDGAAKGIIEGLSKSGDQYDEAIKCLRDRFNRPKLIHEAHVQRIIEIPPLKEGNGKELRSLHDTAQQHIRALKCMGHEPSKTFLTSLLQLKLDQTTRFEWQKHNQSEADVALYTDLLEFINLRAQATETLTPDQVQPKRIHKGDFLCRNRPQPFHASHAAGASTSCVACKADKHPLYMCPTFKDMPRDGKVSVVRSNDLCLNCFKPGHFAKQCASTHKCKRCQKAHHTLLHDDSRDTQPPSSSHRAPTVVEPVASHTSTGSNLPNTLLMTCQVGIKAPNGTLVKVRALLDSGSTTSFVSERVVQSLNLSRRSQCLTVSGIGGTTHNSPLSSVSTLEISSLHVPSTKFAITAIVVPRVTCDLPLRPVYNHSNWSHLSNITLADPDFATPGKIDLLLGADVYSDVLLNGRRCGPHDTPSAFETKFGWVLMGRTSAKSSGHTAAASHHTAIVSGDDLIRKFWETEENPKHQSNLSVEERSVVRHFEENHSRSETGRFVVPLPKNPQSQPLGESRSQAVRRFLTLERALYAKGQFQEFSRVVEEYFELNHAEPVPPQDLEKPVSDTFYLPMHAVRKEHSTTTKLRVVFDASAKSNSGVSLNDTLLVGPTIHPSLVDVLLRFRTHRIALTADISKMYRAVELAQNDKDLHRFVWRKNVKDSLRDYRMTRVTFGVSASSFAANMAVKQNAVDFATEFPDAAKVVERSFYVDDCLTGADSIAEAITLQTQLHSLLSKGGFILRKWNSNEAEVLKHLPPDLKDTPTVQSLPSPDEYTKTLGIEWNATMDHFRLTIAKLPPLNNVTKRMLVSDIAKTFDVLGWFAPTVIKVKILLQRLWEQKVEWDDPVPTPIFDDWAQWRSELPLLSNKHIPRCYFNKDSNIVSLQLHGFSDASENAYAAVIYLRMTDVFSKVQVSLITAKTKVAPIKRLTIPRLELCGAQLLAQLLSHVKDVLSIPLSNVYAWTDSTIVLSWLVGNPRRFKTFVGNRVSYIVDVISPDRWNHVEGLENPADCASRGLFPSELLNHALWWHGPDWLQQDATHWPKQVVSPSPIANDEEREISLHISACTSSPIVKVEDFSSFTRLTRVTAWIFRFLRNCRSHKLEKEHTREAFLSTEELQDAEVHWYKDAQFTHFSEEIVALKSRSDLNKSSPILSLRPFLDSSGLLRVGGRQQYSPMSYSQKHPIILHHDHHLTHLIVRTTHLKLLHAGPTLLTASLGPQYHILGCRKLVRSITRACVICRKLSAKPSSQLMGQLPLERLTPGPVFDTVGIDFAGPVQTKYGHVRKPVIVKSYVCLFVSLSVKAVHLEPVSDLTSEAFIAALRRFIARRGKPRLIMSDHGTNFVGAHRELQEMYDFLSEQRTQGHIADFCSIRNIQWKFIPERAPHFGGLWEAAVKSMKFHFKRVIGDTKLDFEELTTVLSQIESCLNSRPLTSLPTHDDDGVECLTPGHFLIGQSLETIPDSAFSYRSFSLLKRWDLCQSLVRHFWKRWSNEYLISLRRSNKWLLPSRNLQVNDIVILQDENLIPAKWPLAKVLQVYPGKDGIIRVATVKTSTGVYKRPVVKLVLLLPSDAQEH